MKKQTIILYLIIFLKFVIQYFLISGEYDLHRDEYLHLDQAHHLAWGFTSVPPLTSWISWLIFQLGNGVFWVKFFPALFGALTILLVWKIIGLLKGDLFAKILGVSAVMFSALFRINILYQPNSLDILCWTLVYFLVINYILTSEKKWLYYLAVAFAFGFLNKYNIFFLLLSLVPALLLTKHRKVFLKKEFYFSIGLALVLISPNLLWQYQNDFPVFKHLHELAETQLVNVNRMDFVKEQFLFFFGGIPLLIAAFVGFARYAVFKPFRVIGYSFLICMSVFLYFKAKPYYAIGLYPAILAFGAVYVSYLLKAGWKRKTAYALVALPVFFTFLTLKAVYPILSPEEIKEEAAFYKKLGLTRWEDGQDHDLPQDFADMLGWKELAAKVDSVHLKLPNADQTLILCDNYGQAGAINYYTKQGIKAVSFNADYVNWFDLDRQYVNLIRVKHFEEKEDELVETHPYFNTSVLADSIANPYAREFKTLVFVFTGAKVDIRKRIKQEIEETKNHL